MRKLFDGVSRKRGRVRPRALFMLTAVAFVVLLTLWPTHSSARRACGDPVTLYSVGETDPFLPSIDCQTAKDKAYRAALQDARAKRAAYVCPQACPTRVDVEPPHVTFCDCIEFDTPDGLRYDGVADAEGTYRCV